MEDHFVVFIRVAQTEYRRYCRYDDRVTAHKKRIGRGKTHLVNVFVDRGIFLDIGVGTRYIGFGLVIVIVGNKILNRIVRKEIPQFRVKLCCQCLVVSQHQARFPGLSNHIGHSECLAAASRPQQRLIQLSRLNTLGQFSDRARLITGRFVIRNQLELMQDFFSV